MERKGYIGGSDVAACMGLSRWKTPLQLWAEKTGEVEPKDLSGNEAVELGTELEDFVAKKFERKTGMKVRRAPQIYFHKQYDYMRCQVDRLIEGKDELLEVKTTSGWNAREWEGDEIPQDYILQVMYQLGITGRKVGYIAVLIGGQSFKWKKIDFDKELFDTIVSKVIVFWDCIQSKTPPMATGDDNDFLLQLFPENDDQYQHIEELNDKIGLLQQLKGTISDTMAQKDEIEAQIKQVIGDCLGVATSQYVVTWKKQDSMRVDVEKLKADNAYDRYTKLSSTRVLRVKRQGEKNE